MKQYRMSGNFKMFINVLFNILTVYYCIINPTDTLYTSIYIVITAIIVITMWLTFFLDDTYLIKTAKQYKDYNNTHLAIYYLQIAITGIILIIYDYQLLGALYTSIIIPFSFIQTYKDMYYEIDY